MSRTKKILHITSAPYRYFKFICFWVGFSVVVSLIALFTFTFFFFHNLPDVKHSSYNDLKRQAQTQIAKKYERKGRRHTWVTIKNMNRDLLYTLVMSEDAEFFNHNGIDHDAIINALFQNVKADTIKFGASTISQQVAKNLYLSGEKSLIRKVKEYFITRDLETYFSKNQILELYANMAEFGPDIFGVYAAGKSFFGKHPKNLNAAEGAYMALMLPSPRKNHYKLIQNKNFTKSFRNKYRRVLRDMRYKEYISPKQYARYIKYKFKKGGKK